MKEKKDHPASLNENIYTLKRVEKLKMILLLPLFLMLGIFFNFPIKKTIESKINLNLKSIKTCPIHYSALTFNYFFPGISLKNVSISSRCFNQAQGDLLFKKMTFSITRPTISPPGIMTLLTLYSEGPPLEVYAAFSPLGSYIKLEEASLKGKMFQSLTNSPAFFKGTIKANALFKLANFRKINEADIHLSSSDLTIPARRISGLSLPKMKIGNLLLKAILRSSKKLNIIKLVIGSKSSPLIAEIDGMIILTPKNILRSKLNLRGKFTFSKSFIESFPLINIFLGGKKKKEGFYRFSISGTFERPTPLIK